MRAITMAIKVTMIPTTTPGLPQFSETVRGVSFNHGGVLKDLAANAVIANNVAPAKDPARVVFQR